ncbi:MAG: hypothetical protein KatS3mg027_0077 [Bacteroidia bacterium]|nr:MAG: hypothetical protein KatS3mg027_0077 [Bacteroidia bacterium]
MRKKRFVCWHILGLIYCLNFYSQYNSEFNFFQYTGNAISLKTEFDAGSNHINADMVNHLFFGGYINKEMKDKALNKALGFNRAGAYFNYNLHGFFSSKKNRDRISYFIAAKQQYLIHGGYTKELFQLAFYGNKSLAGNTANLANSNINTITFNEFKVGVLFKKVDSTAKIGISLSVLQGNRLIYFNFGKNSSLFTSSSYDQIIFNSNLNVTISDTSQKKWYQLNGIGASTDIYFETPYKSKLGKMSILSVNINNFGFIHWLRNSVKYTTDTVLNFTGYHINSIYDLKDSTLNKINADSTFRKITNARKGEFNTNIPTNLILYNKIFFGNMKFSLGTGFRYIFNANYKPYIFTEPAYQFTSRFHGTLHFGYGGYSLFNFGFSIMYQTSQWHFYIGSNNLQGWILPKISYGQGFFFMISKKLK